MFKHILLPTDGSEASLRAVEKGIELAKAFGSKLTLMTALDHFSLMLHRSGTPLPDDPMVQAAKAAAAHWLGVAQAQVAREGLKAEELIMQESNVHQSIVAAANACNADLIIMGTHGAGALERWMVGSQTQRVLAHTTVPVLVVH